MGNIYLDYTYSSYLETGEKHLNVCKTMVKDLSLDSKDTLLEIYYLCGYILEGAFVYAIFKHYKWPAEKSIQKYDNAFSIKNNICFYKRDTNGYVKYSLEAHCFQGYINCIRKDFSTVQIPYLNQDCQIDSDVKELIDAWSPKIRYLSRFQIDETGLNISKDCIIKLIDTCTKIVNSITKYI